MLTIKYFNKVIALNSLYETELGLSWRTEVTEPLFSCSFRTWVALYFVLWRKKGTPKPCIGLWVDKFKTRAPFLVCARTYTSIQFFYTQRTCTALFSVPLRYTWKLSCVLQLIKLYSKNFLPSSTSLWTLKVHQKYILPSSTIQFTFEEHASRSSTN